MKRNILNKLAIVGVLLVLVSCKAHKLVVANNPSGATAPAEHKPDTKVIAVRAHQLQFSTFAARADAKLNVDGNSNDVTINIRINHDKEIWVSITKTVIINIEVARAVITPDSIQIINKLQGVYLKKPFSYVYNYSNQQINYKMLEAILVGNAIPEVLNDTNSKVTGDIASINISGNLQDLIYQLLFGAEMKTTQLNLNNNGQGQTLQINYSNFIKANDGLVPSQVDIQSGTPKNKIQASLHYTKVDLNQPLQYPFNIPERYTSADGN